MLAGLLAGVAGGLKPPNYLFVIGAVLAYLAARRWREGAAFAIMIVPSILVLALWKERGLGYIPALTLQHVQLAAGSSSVAGTDVNLDRYIDLDFQHWRDQMDQLREFFWSARLAQWAPFAGLIAVIRVQRGAIAALLGGWLAAFIVVKGFSPRASIETNTFWRLLMPAWPAYLLLFAAIPLLVPTLARRLGERIRPPKTIAIQWRWVAVAAVAAVVVPFGVIAASDPVDASDTRDRPADRVRSEHPHPRRRRHRDARRANGNERPRDLDPGLVAGRCLLSRLPHGRAGRRHAVRPVGELLLVLLPLEPVDRDDARAGLRRHVAPGRRRDVPDRRGARTGSTTRTRATCSCSVPATALHR